MLKQSIQYPDTAQIENLVEIDQSTLNGSNFARGLEILLRHAGCQTDYVTVMGDTGEAFLMSGTEYDPKLTGGYADLGWWALDRWHIVSRLPFLSWANGVELHHHDVDFSGVGSDPAKTYARLFHATVCEEIAHGRVLLACWDGCHLVTGYDTGNPPLLGWCLVGDKAESMRMNDYPCAITTYGSECKAMDRLYADRMALRHAVDLGRGGVKNGLWVTGPLAWKGWEDHLVKRTTFGYWHNSIKWNGLKTTRDTAVKYLESMAVRHSDPVAEILRIAADIYRQQLEVVGRMPDFDEKMIGKEQTGLVDLIRTAAALDFEAIEKIEAAIPLMPE